MAANQSDKYRRFYNITQPKIHGGDKDEVAREKIIKVIANGLDINTLVQIEAKTLKSTEWSVLDTITGTIEKLVDISMYDQVRFNVVTYGGTEASIEIVSAVHTEAIHSEKDIEGKESIRVINAIPVEGDNRAAYLNASLTLQFWNTISFDTSVIDFVTTDDSEPVLDNSGNFIEV